MTDPSYSLSEVARRDLQEISDYSVRTWGAERADEYLAELVATFLIIAEQPGAGRLVPDRRYETRRFTARAHHVLYGPREGELVILSVVHQSRDLVRYLNSLE